MNKHIVIFSHGFGVQKDSRGLFTNIAACLKDVEPILFDYGIYDDEAKTLTVRPIHEEAEMLTKVVTETQEQNPYAIIDLVAHSQGCVVAALAKPEGIRKTILLAPPPSMNIELAVKKFGARQGVEVHFDGSSKLHRKDGSVTLVPKEYWADRKSIDPMSLYNELADVTELTIVKAGQDEMLGDTDFSALNNKTKVVEIAGNHNFYGESRAELLATVASLLT